MIVRDAITSAPHNIQEDNYRATQPTVDAEVAILSTDAKSLAGSGLLAPPRPAQYRLVTPCRSRSI